MVNLEAVFFDNYIPNWHTPMEEVSSNILILITDGKVAYKMNGGEFTGETGDLIFFPKSTVRSGDNHPSGLHQKYSILFSYDEITMKEVPFIANKTFFKCKIRNFQHVLRCFQRLFDEYRSSERYHSIICKGILLELIGLISRELEKKEVTPAKMKNVEVIKRYLLEHYREPVKIEQLAKMIHRSPNYTISIFREVVGQTPIQYMHQLRIMEACNLLLYSDMTISNISSYLGYYDTSYFFRVFKKYTSMSPTDFVTYGHSIKISQLFAR